jgi:hypothetical protein
MIKVIDEKTLRALSDVPCAGDAKSPANPGHAAPAVSRIAHEAGVKRLIVSLIGVRSLLLFAKGLESKEMRDDDSQGVH